MISRHATLLVAVLALHACRERDRGNNATSTTVPTVVTPQPVAPPPMMPAPNALADAAVMPPPMPPGPPVPPVAAAPDAAAPVAPTAPAAPADPTSTAAARPRDPSTAPVEIPSPIQGVPGVRVRRNRHSTGVNVGGIQLNLPTQ